VWSGWNSTALLSCLVRVVVWEWWAIFSPSRYFKVWDPWRSWQWAWRFILNIFCSCPLVRSDEQKAWQALVNRTSVAPPHLIPRAGFEVCIGKGKKNYTAHFSVNFFPAWFVVWILNDPVLNAEVISLSTRHLYRVIQEESALLWEMIVWVRF